MPFSFSCSTIFLSCKGCFTLIDFWTSCFCQSSNQPRIPYAMFSFLGDVTLHRCKWICAVIVMRANCKDNMVVLLVQECCISYLHACMLAHVDLSIIGLLTNIYDKADLCWSDFSNFFMFTRFITFIYWFIRCLYLNNFSMMLLGLFIFFHRITNTFLWLNF